MKKSPVTPADLVKHAYREQQGVIIICRSEQDQESIYNELRKNYPEHEIKVVNT